MKTFLTPVLFSAVAILWGFPSLAVPYTLREYHIAVGNMVRVPISLRQPSVYTLSVSAHNGDADIYVDEPNGNRIGVGDQVGNDSLTGNLAAGTYTVSIYMASCRNRSASCTANFTVTASSNDHTH